MHEWIKLISLMLINSLLLKTENNKLRFLNFDLRWETSLSEERPDVPLQTLTSDFIGEPSFKGLHNKKCLKHQ